MPRYLSTDVPKVLRKYTINADDDKEVPDPNYGTDPVPHSIRQFLPFAPKWATWPDYQRVRPPGRQTHDMAAPVHLREQALCLDSAAWAPYGLLWVSAPGTLRSSLLVDLIHREGGVQVFWMNHALRTLWPYYNKAIGKMVMDMARPMIEEQLKPVRCAMLAGIPLVSVAGSARTPATAQAPRPATQAEEVPLSRSQWHKTGAIACGAASASPPHCGWLPQPQASSAGVWVGQPAPTSDRG